MATIIDIAKACGVSTATVSYALNGKGNISEEKRAQIRETAREMNYVPSQAARNLQKGKSDVVCVIIPDITSFFNNQVFGFIEQKLRAHHLQVIVACSRGKEDLETEIFERTFSQKPLGIIWFPKEATERTFERIDAMLETYQIPTLAVYKKMGNTKRLKYLEWDIQDGIKKVTEYLLEKGLSDIFYFGSKDCDHYSTLKYRGYEQAFLQRGLPVPDFVCYMEQTYLSAQTFTKAFIKSGRKLPQAIVAVNDITGYGIVSALEEHGVKVPQQVSVVGIDGVRFYYTKHKMTTVTPDLRILAEKCVDIIHAFGKYPKEIYRIQNQIEKGTTSL